MRHEDLWDHGYIDYTFSRSLRGEWSASHHDTYTPRKWSPVPTG
jgi:hypothetical protein